MLWYCRDEGAVPGSAQKEEGKFRNECSEEGQVYEDISLLTHIILITLGASQGGGLSGL